MAEKLQKEQNRLFGGSFTFKINIVCLLKQVTIHLPSYAQIFFSLFQDFYLG